MSIIVKTLPVGFSGTSSPICNNHQRKTTISGKQDVCQLKKDWFSGERASPRATGNKVRGIRNEDVVGRLHTKKFRAADREAGRWDGKCAWLASEYGKQQTLCLTQVAPNFFAPSETNWALARQWLCSRGKRRFLAKQSPRETT